MYIYVYICMGTPLRSPDVTSSKTSHTVSQSQNPCRAKPVKSRTPHVPRQSNPEPQTYQAPIPLTLSKPANPASWTVYLEP